MRTSARCPARRTVPCRNQPCYGQLRSALRVSRHLSGLQKKISRKDKYSVSVIVSSSGELCGRTAACSPRSRRSPAGPTKRAQQFILQNFKSSRSTNFAYFCTSPVCPPNSTSEMQKLIRAARASSCAGPEARGAWPALVPLAVPRFPVSRLTAELSAGFFASQMWAHEKIGLSGSAAETAQ